VFLQPGENKRLSFAITTRQLSLIDAKAERIVEPGLFEVNVGGKQPGFAGAADAATTDVVMGRFEVLGET
jgi:beta-glucosidase